MRNERFISVTNVVFDGNEKQYVTECIDTGWVSANGRFVPLFEAAFARYCGAQHAVATSSGTTALHLALLALGVGPGDEVIVPTLTYIATANAVTYCGAKPVFVDSEPETWNIDPERIESCISPRTRGIIVVHLYGHPVDMEPVLALARRKRLFVLEDAAEAHGAEYRGRRAGGLADAGIFSFFGNKVITTGEGGMIVTNRQDVADRARWLRGQGMDPQRRYWFPIVGYNYRMTNLQAAVGLAQLERIHLRLAERRRVAEWYNRRLALHSGLLVLPIEQPWARHTFWLYSILLRDGSFIQRDALIEELWRQGIETRPMFYPIHTMPPYRDDHLSLPVAESLASRGISLPTHSLLTEEDVDHITEVLIRCCA